MPPLFQCPLSPPNRPTPRLRVWPFGAALLIAMAPAAQADDLTPTLAKAAQCKSLTTERCPSLAALVGRGAAALPAAVGALGSMERAVRLVGVDLIGRAELGEVAARRAALTTALPAVDAQHRGEGLQALGALGGTEAPALLLEAIADTEGLPRNRAYAANGLSVIRSPAARDALANALNDPQPRVQEAAARALGQSRDPAAVAPLARRATAEMTAGYVRAAAARSLGQLGDRKAIAALVLVLATDSAAARSDAAKALGRLGDRTVVPVLLARLSDTAALEGIVDALAVLGDKRGVTALASIAADRNASARVRKRALWALGTTGDASALSGITRVLGDPKHPALVMAAVEALGRIALPEAAPALMDLLDTEDKALKETLAWALGKCTGQSLGTDRAAWEAWLEGR